MRTPLAGLLAVQRLDHATVDRVTEPPARGTGGKVHTAIPFPAIRQEETSS